MTTHDAKFAYSFDASVGIHGDEAVALLGGKAAGLAMMTQAGFPVPHGFTLTTEACREFLRSGWSAEMDAATRDGLAELERRTGKRLGDPTTPLLLSVRSGAPASMPGMMDTGLNVGMTDAVERALASLTGNEEFARDTHRRAVLSFADIAGIAEPVRVALSSSPTAGAARDILAGSGLSMPADPIEQVIAAIRSVFRSWNSERAMHYRRIEELEDASGTAATVQVMVFGNLGEESGTGVAFTRNPSSGAPGLMGDFLLGAQGEDVVAGEHQTLPLDEMRQRWPQLWEELVGHATALELLYADMVDIEFTVERDKLWILQARRAKRSPAAAFRAAVDMANTPQFPVDRAEAVRRCQSYLDDPPTLRAPATEGDDLHVIGRGLPAAPGLATGVLCLDVDKAVELEASGTDVILARDQTSPADIHGIAAAKGLITTSGGLVSHAAVIARSWGMPAIVGAHELTLHRYGVVGPGGSIDLGEIVTVDGATGELLLGARDTARIPVPEVATILEWSRLGEESDPAHPTAGSDTVVDFSMMHFLRVKGLATVADLAERTGMSHGEITQQLNILQSVGEVRHIEARGLWQLLPPGREHHLTRLAEAKLAVDTGDLRYEEFLALNHGFKQLCTMWQLRDGTPNDHSDEAYDTATIACLARHDDEAQPVLAAIAATLSWAADYPARLAHARHRVVSGETHAFTGVLQGSYHDIWMELHEDLIVTLGINRAEEGST